MKIYKKFIAVKVEDVEKYLDDEQKTQLRKICDFLCYGRAKDGKKMNEYIVINTDEPYFDEVVKLMEHEG